MDSSVVSDDYYDLRLGMEQMSCWRSEEGCEDEDVQAILNVGAVERRRQGATGTSGD